MKFIKANLTLVICGAVVVLSLVAWLVWPLPGLRAEVQQDMGGRYNEATSEIQHIVDTPLQLPDQPLIKGPPSKEYVGIKSELIKEVNDQKTKVDKESHDVNARGRIDDHGVPLLQTVEIKNGALSWGTAEPSILPVSRGTEFEFEFKSNYGAQFHEWLSLLATGKLPANQTAFDPGMASPPAMEKLRQAYQDTLKGKDEGVGAAAVQADPADELRYDRQALLNLGLQLYTYVDPGAFQVRPWFSTAESPNEEQMFSALVDSWLQADVVRAIAAVNGIPGRSPGVDASPVKRLIQITVGDTALQHVLLPGTGTSGGQLAVSPTGSTDPDLFYPSNEPGGTAGAGPSLGASLNGAAVPVQSAAPNKIDYAMGMTGHASGGDYDVVYMSIHMDIDPAGLIDFMDKLYLQNVGYTVTDVQLKTVDPLDRTSNGYIYGNKQVVEAEIQVEAILFRSWTARLMPATLRASRGIPEPAK